MAEIETVNILGATKLAMRRALEGIYPPTAFEKKEEPDLFASAAEKEAFQPTVSCQILVDGLPLRHFPYPHQGIVSGDGRSLCIAMASIIAKVTRDRLMDELDKVVNRPDAGKVLVLDLDLEIVLYLSCHIHHGQ